MATNVIAPIVSRGWAKNLGLWLLQITIAFLMILAARSKLTGDPEMVKLFQIIGVGQWFRYLTGSLELTGAIGLLIPGLSGSAAILTATVMLGAVIAHLAVLGGSPLIALALLLGSVLISFCKIREEMI